MSRRTSGGALSFYSLDEWKERRREGTEGEGIEDSLGDEKVGRDRWVKRKRKGRGKISQNGGRRGGRSVCK